MMPTFDGGSCERIECTLLELASPDRSALCIAPAVGSLGDCGDDIGFVFDGTRCARAFGCPMAGGPTMARPVFATAGECALACAGAGLCVTELLRDVGDCASCVHCEAFTFDMRDAASLAAACTVVGELTCDCDARGPGCASAGYDRDEGYERACALTLLPEPEEARCDPP
jgi:hypothetical protein